MNEEVQHAFIDFVSGSDFKKFEIVIAELYRVRLLGFQQSTSKDALDVLTDRNALNFYLNLPGAIKSMTEQIIENQIQKNSEGSEEVNGNRFGS